MYLVRDAPLPRDIRPPTSRIDGLPLLPTLQVYTIYPA